MSITIVRGDTDEIVNSFVAALKTYKADHPRAQIALYRQNPVSIRVRIIDPDFHGLERSERHEKVWKYLETLSDEFQDDLSMLVLLTPNEVSRSFANMEFEDPVPSVI